MTGNIHKNWPIWLAVIGFGFEAVDLGLKFFKERRLRDQLEKDDEVRESKNQVVNRCLQILQENQKGRTK